MNHLSTHVEIKGSLTFSQELLLDGRVEGDVSSTAALTIGEMAFVKGTVNTRSVVISGHVEGNITVQERCQLKSTATILGNITAATFSIEAGAVFCGHSQIRPPASSPNPPPNKRPRTA